MLRYSHNRRGGVAIRAAIQLIAALVFCAGAVQPAVAAVVVKGPYMLYPDDPECMTLLLQTDETADQVLLRWGPSPTVAEGLAVVEESGERQYIYRLCGLEPGQRTYYHFEVDASTHPGDFLAAPTIEDREVTIYGYGDTRTNNEIHDSVAARLLLDVDEDAGVRQTVLLHTGDWVSGGETESSWDDQFFDRTLRNVLEMVRRLPVMGCRGNHESSGTLLRKYWPYQGLQTESFNHAFDYGPIHVVVVDQYEDMAPGSDQHAWVEDSLASSGHPWKIVLLHEPAWSAGSHPNDQPTQDDLLPLFVEYEVTLVIAGHNHYYARAVVDGIQHVTSGGAGAPLYTPDPDDPYVVVAAMENHFVRIEVDFDGVYSTFTLTAIDVDGLVLDSVTLSSQVCFVETCDHYDDDCDGEIDEPGALGCVVYYTDEDGDGYGMDGDGICLCKPIPPRDATAAGDCDDGDAALQPEDHDGDGFSTCDGDCADLFPGINPGAAEDCRDGLDNDCDGLIDREDADCAGWTDTYLPADERGGCTCSAGARPSAAPWLVLGLFALWLRAWLNNNEGVRHT